MIASIYKIRNIPSCRGSPCKERKIRKLLYWTVINLDKYKCEHLKSRAFENTFVCMQLVNICTLYEAFDMEEEEVKNIMFEFSDADNVFIGSPMIQLEWEAESMEKGADILEIVRRFPMLQKRTLAMIPKGLHGVSSQRFLIFEVESAMRQYFCVALHCLISGKSRFIEKDVKKYMSSFMDICKLFKNGMTKEFIEGYITKELGWSFEKDMGGG